MIVGVVLVSLGCASPRQQAILERRQADLQEQVAGLEAKVSQLEGKVATLAKRVPTRRQAAKPADPADADRADPSPRVTESPSGDAPPDAVAARVPTPATVATPMPDLDLDGLRRESARQLPPRYERGLEQFRAGEYEQAIQTMRDFARAKHTSPFVGGALYWIGQAYLQLGQFYQAVLAFTDVQQRFPHGEYAPAAAYASGVAFQALGNTSEARRAFETVVTEHPTAPEAAKARVRLTAIADRR